VNERIEGGRCKIESMNTLKRLLDPSTSTVGSMVAVVVPLALFFGPIVAGFVLGGLVGLAGGFAIAVLLMLKPVWALLGLRSSPLAERMFGGECAVCDDITLARVQREALNGHLWSRDVVLPDGVIKELAATTSRR
jgi:hypothetical protein